MHRYEVMCSQFVRWQYLAAVAYDVPSGARERGAIWRTPLIILGKRVKCVLESIRVTGSFEAGIHALVASVGCFFPVADAMAPLQLGDSLQYAYVLCLILVWVTGQTTDHNLLSRSMAEAPKARGSQFRRL